MAANLFDVIGASPAIGRTFQAADEQSGAAPVVVLSHGLWKRLSGDPRLVGQTITMDDRSYTVIGVMPASFWFIYRDSAMWVPAPVSRAELDQTGDVWMVGRLESGTTLQQAQAEMNTIAQRRANVPQVRTSREPRPIRVELLAKAWRSAYASSVLLLQVLVGFVLLIACANVANLLLVRGNARRNEFAIRMALGASRRQLTRQVLVECGLLSVAGSVIGVFLAWNSLGVIQSHLPPDLMRFFRFSQEETLGLDLRALGFALLLCVVATIAFGLVPALRASRPDLNTDLKEASRTSGMGRRRHALARLLMISELAMSMALLVGVSAMVRSLILIHRKDLGFRADQVLRVTVDLDNESGGDGRRRFSAFQQIADRLRMLPGIQTAGALDHPYAITGSATPSGRPLATQTSTATDMQARAEPFKIDGQYFRVMGLSLKRGRSFGTQDRPNTGPVAIVAESLADHLWPNSDPVGKLVRLESHDRSSPAPWISIVGVVSDVYHPLGRGPQPLLYLPYTQDANPAASRTFVLLTTLPPVTMTPTIRAAVHEIAPGATISAGQTMDVSSFAAHSRFITVMLGSFTGLALVLALVGVYGVMHYWVAERVHEIGLRMALGARQLDTVVHVVGTAAKLAITGIAFGIVAGAALSRMLAHQVQGAQAANPLMIITTSILLFAAATLAGLVPARRAARIDPLTALRSE